mgnify:FL=1
MWVFEGWIEPDVDADSEVAEWSVTVEMVAMFEDNREASKIPVKQIEVTGPDAEGHVEDKKGVITVESGNKVSFGIRSETFVDADPRLGDVGETKFKIVDGSIGVEEVVSA